MLLDDTPLHTGNRRNTSHVSRNARPFPLAPGVVVIPAPGIGPKARLVYVRLAGGREFLFAAPAAALQDSLDTVRPPARLASRNDAPDSATETKAWLMTINALHRTAPDMTVVPAYEGAPIPDVAEEFSDHS
ncbi:MAG: hypothetical protein P8Y48_03910 [Novosphingobium sp.]